MTASIDAETVNELIDKCNQHINDGDCDTFRSYEEGIKDTLEWLFYGGGEPDIVDTEEE